MMVVIYRGLPVKAKTYSKQKLMKKSALRKQFAATKKPQDKIKKSIISPHAKGNVAGALSSARDITERKKAEEALRLANAYNRSLIEASLDPLVTIGPNGKIMDVNNATEAATGYSRQELIGRDFSDYFTKPDEARSGYQQVFKEGFVRDYPLEIHHRNGHIMPVLYNASVYRDETGKIAGVFAAARDITKRKQAEEKILRLNEELEQRVIKRTAEISAKTTELERINKVFVDRELRMRELKARIAELERKEK